MPFPRPALRGLLLAFAAGVPAAALADPPQVQPVADVVVTATRLPTIVADTPDAEVITRTQIDNLQSVFAQDLLRFVPGLSVTDDGAFGGVASVRLLGASSDKTLVLIDGVPQNDPADPNGAYDFANLDVADIGKVEILEGPQSSIWGSDAIGGVISMTTREDDGWRLQGEGGTLNTFDGSAGVGRRTDAWALGASVSGISSMGVAKADGIGPPNPYWSWTAGGYGRYTPSATLSLDAHLRYDQSYAGVDGYDANTFAFGYTPQYATTRAWTGDVRGVVQAPRGFTDTFTAGVYRQDRADTYIGQPFDSSAYTALTQDYRFVATRGADADPWGVTLGAERIGTDAELSTGQRESLGTTSGFVEGRVTPWAPLTITAAGRFDAPDSYASAATGHVGVVWKLGAGFALEGSWGQGFKTPTISEIFCDFCTNPGPVAGLRPEHAQGYDAALQWTSADGALLAKVTGYELDVTDQIEFSDSFPFTYVNLDHTRTDGVEVEFDGRLTEHLTAQAEYAYTNALDLDSGTQMLRVPRDTGSLVLTWTQGRFTGSINVRGEGADADIDPASFTPATRPGFVLAGATASWAFSDHLELTGRVEDVANTHYQEALGYGEPRRMLFIGIRAKG
ncbi:MAG TPA: TonB-dependent receptor [Caulobacteraceae bacterium]